MHQAHTPTTRKTKYWWHLNSESANGIAVQTLRKTEETRMGTLELKTGEKIKVLNGACMVAEIKDNLPVMYSKVVIKNVEVLREGGCNGVVLKES